MTFPKFLGLLFIVTIVASGFHLLFLQLDFAQPYKDFSILSIVFFTGLSIFFFFLGILSSTSKDLYMFNRVIILTVMMKLTFSLLVIIIYSRKMNPPTKYFVVPFFLYYLLYTGFELYYMTRLTKPDTTSK